MAIFRSYFSGLPIGMEQKLWPKNGHLFWQFHHIFEKFSSCRCSPKATAFQCESWFVLGPFSGRRSSPSVPCHSAISSGGSSSGGSAESREFVVPGVFSFISGKQSNMLQSLRSIGCTDQPRLNTIPTLKSLNICNMSCFVGSSLGSHFRILCVT